MTILVTGIAGFIGSHLAEKLQALGHKIIGVDNFNDFYPIPLKESNVKDLIEKGATVIRGDLRHDATYLDIPTQIDYVYHCAAQPGISSASTFEDYNSNNLVATKKLVKFIKEKCQIKFFVNTGTSSIYGEHVDCDEDFAPQPISNYGVTKLAAEQLMLSSVRQGFFRGCSLRLYSVYGSRERPDKMFSRLITSALKNESFPLYEGSLEHRRSFTHITDIIEGMVNVIGREAECHNQIINLGNTTEYSTKEAIETVEILAKATIKTHKEPARLGDQFRTKAVIKKAERLLDFAPKTTLIRGVQEQIEWQKSRDIENNTGMFKIA